MGTYVEMWTKKLNCGHINADSFRLAVFAMLFCSISLLGVLLQINNTVLERSTSELDYL